MAQQLARSSATKIGQAATDAIVTWIRAVDAHLKALGLIAS